MRKIIAMSLFALGSLTMFATEKTNVVISENKIEIDKGDQFDPIDPKRCYEFIVYQEFILAPGQTAKVLIYKEYFKGKGGAAIIRQMDLQAQYPNYIVGSKIVDDSKCL